MRVTVIGAGYVGLVTASCFAETGNEVVCIDIDAEKIDKLNSGSITIYEPDLITIFERNSKEGRLKFTTSLDEGIDGAEVIFLALPTPANENGAADLSYLLNLSDSLGPLLKEYVVIVDKSTVPVGTAELVKNKISAKTNVSFDVVSNPEFLREGFAVEDFLKPDRIVIGTSSVKARDILERLYKPFVRQGNPIYFMDESSAEMTKYAANTYLAMKISFMNEIANLCELVGADIDAVRLGIGADERIGKRFLFAGIGYGGSCFPKDVKALAHIATQANYDFKLINAVEQVNKVQKQVLFKKIQKYYQGQLDGKTFALWGLAFKPDTDDIREAPSIDIINALVEAGANVVAYDPEATDNMRRLFNTNNNLTFVENDEYEALRDADALIVATEWAAFRAPDFKKIESLMKAKVIFDGRNLFELKDIKDLGFHYESIGREIINP